MSCASVKSMREWIKAIMVLPFNALVVIPALFLYFGGYKFALPSRLFFALGIIFFLSGAFLFIWTLVLFEKVGKGTLAPWSPTQNLVVKGPYCFVRNPMLSGVLAMLAGESLMLGSVQIFAWAVLFFVINTFYFIFVEEKGLSKRFGVDYALYKKSVPRWIPRLSKWQLPSDSSGKGD